jgi:phosphocarrier protein HPr
MIQQTLSIKNRLGLHARASAKVVNLANKFGSDITLICKGKKAYAKSILEVMMLGAVQGDECQCEVEGDDETDAAAAMRELFDARFGEDS